MLTIKVEIIKSDLGSIYMSLVVDQLNARTQKNILSGFDPGDFVFISFLQARVNIDRQTDRQTGRQTDRHMQIYQEMS